MGNAIDIQEKLALVASEDFTLTTTPGDVNGSTEVDIVDFSGFAVGFQLSAALGGSDDVRYKFQFSDDGGSTWEDANAEAYLPTFKQDGNNKLENPVSPYIQVAGIGEMKGKTCRLVLTVVSLATGKTVTVRYLLQALNRPFMGWTTTLQPADGLP